MIRDLSKIKNIVMAELGDDYKVSVVNIPKNNRILKGIRINGGSNVQPTFYPSEAPSHMTDEEVARNIVSIYREYKGVNKNDVGKIFDNRDFVLDNIVPQLIGKEKNASMLKNLYYDDFLDMAVIYRVMLSGDHSCLMTKELMNHLDINNITMHKYALRNASKQVTVTPAADILFGGGTDEKINIRASSPLHVVTNTNKMYGSCYMLDEDLLQEFSEEVGGDFYILPSSIHESLFATQVDDVDYLKSMVSDVNRTEVDDDDILTNSVYKYIAKERKVVIV